MDSADLIEWALQAMDFVAALLPGQSFGERLEAASNLLGVLGFFLSVVMLAYTLLFRRGRRRIATRGDLDGLGAAVADLVGARLAERIAAKASPQAIPADITPPETAGSPQERIRNDVTAAVERVLADVTSSGREAAAALVRGETEPAERLLAARASDGATRSKDAAEALHLQAALASTRDLEAALSSCQRAISLEPGDALGWSRIGHLYLRMGRLDDARTAFEKALSLGA